MEMIKGTTTSAFFGLTVTGTPFVQQDVTHFHTLMSGKTQTSLSSFLRGARSSAVLVTQETLHSLSPTYQSLLTDHVTDYSISAQCFAILWEADPSILCRLTDHPTSIKTWLMSPQQNCGTS